MLGRHEHLPIAVTVTRPTHSAIRPIAANQRLLATTDARRLDNYECIATTSGRLGTYGASLGLATLTKSNGVVFAE